MSKQFQMRTIKSELPMPAAPPSLGLLSMLNPLGAISDIVGSILEYKRQIKDIEFQMLKVREQASLMHDKIEIEKEIALATLEAQQSQINHSLNITQIELH